MWFFIIMFLFISFHYNTVQNQREIMPHLLPDVFMCQCVYVSMCLLPDVFMCQCVCVNVFIARCVYVSMCLLPDVYMCQCVY